MKLPWLFQREDKGAGAPAGEVSPVDEVLAYHKQTKHHYHRFAASLGYLDWDTQPDPFRRFSGAPLFRLPLLPESEDPAYLDCFVPGAIAPEPVNVDSLSRFFRNALALSASKRFGSSHWYLRVNPSSGNLHPTEGYLILPRDVPGGSTGDATNILVSGVYHYASKEHGLERRAGFTERADASPLAPDVFFVGLSSIHWRESWKYGERAYRYCQHDTGHAIGALRLSAAVLGWRLELLEEFADAEVAALLGLDRTGDFEEAEDEDPDCIAVVFPSTAHDAPGLALCDDLMHRIAGADWQGRANRLSLSHHEWPIIDQTALKSRKPRTGVVSRSPVHPGIPSPDWTTAGAERIIQQRRSAVSLDGKTSITAQMFFRFMQRLLPEINPIPFDALEHSVMAVPRIHLCLFVHRVDGVDPGLYFLVRNSDRLSELKALMPVDFEWSVAPGAPSGLPLFCLRKGDMRKIAGSVSCGQDIAADGAFSLGMIAELGSPVRATGAWLYRRLFWEAGLIGQILYLDAEAAGVRATGIGCYFDDPVNEMLGFTDYKYQSLYHFTIGGPVDDNRLTTEPPYQS